MLASQHGVLGKLLRHGEIVDSTLRSGQHLLSVNGYHYVFQALPESERQKIHVQYGIRGSPVFSETLNRIKNELKSLGTDVEHRAYKPR